LGVGCAHDAVAVDVAQDGAGGGGKQKADRRGDGQRLKAAARDGAAIRRFGERDSPSRGAAAIDKG